MPVDDWRDPNQAARQMAAEALALAADAEAKAKNLQPASPAWEVLATVTIAGPLSISLGWRDLDWPVAAALAGDRVQIFRTARPFTTNSGGVSVVVGGTAIEVHATVFEAGKVPLVYMPPAVTLGLTLNIPLRFVGYRPAA